MFSGYYNLATGELAPAHLLGTTNDGRNLYCRVEGWRPNEPYEEDADGNWIPIGSVR